jgi:hypothetical protein
MKNSLLVHKHLIIRAEADKPPVDEEQLKSWMLDFIASINMKVFMGPYVKYCNMPGKEEFNVKKIEYKYLNRETGLVDI